MNDSGKSLAELSATIREHSLKPVSTDMADIKEMADDFRAAVATISLPSRTDAAPFADSALHFYRIARSSKDPITIRHSLHCLLRAGRFGRILCARYIHGKAIPLKQLASLIGNLPAGDRLALAHEMLLDYPGDHDRQTVAWLEGLTQPLAAVPAEELVPFVASLGAMGEALAFPAKQVIMGGHFGQWVKTTLKTGTSGETLEQLCHIVIALDDPTHAKTLAVSIKVGFISPTPCTLATIAEAAETGDREVLDTFLSVIKSGKSELAGACLDGIIAQQPQAAGQLLATLQKKMLSMKRAANSRIPLLGDAGLRAYIAALPRAMRKKAILGGFGALIAIAPDYVEGASRMGTALTAPSEPTPQKEAPASPITETNTCPKPSFLTRLFGSRKKTLEKILPKFRNFRDMDLSCSNVSDSVIDGCEMIDLDLSDSAFNKVDFIRARLGGDQFGGSTFTDGSHKGNTYTGVDFTGADFTNVTFSKCSFNDCNFSGAAFTNCTFTECRFRNCTLGGAAYLSSKVIRTGFTASVLSSATFYETKIRSCRFEDTDFCSAEFTSAELSGVELLNTVFYGASLTGTPFRSVDMPGSSVAHCRISNSDLPHALFLKNRIRQFPKLADDLLQTTLPDPTVVPPESAAKMLQGWSRELTFYRREAKMQTFNRRRVRRALGAMDREKQVYLRILPHLLNTDVFEKKFDLNGVPTCEVWGYTPSLATLELANQYFPEHKPSRRRAQVQIVAVYAMGSLGSVAQTAKSDIDCWVCYEGDLSMDEANGLKRKLDALGLWAESEFGLEAHFFPMAMDDVRANQFSSGDEESSGSAQALLLKEEFYRTALRIAGKHLAWWVTPAGAGKKEYEQCIQAIRRYPLTGKPRLEDFGHLAPIPADEYFGGSLWQMVKAVHSPFKSVLKLGLLETYADNNTSNLPLCDRIKHNLFTNRHGVKRTDPYATLFSTLRGYYSRRGDSEAARLLTESFMLKVNLSDLAFFLNMPARFEDASLLESLFGTQFVDPDKVDGSNAAWTFNKSLKVGRSVRHYMVDTYQRIQSTMADDDTKRSLINAEDLTRMGRRIGANFSKKPHKIRRVPFMGSKGAEFPILHLSAEKAPGKKPIWVARGGTPSEAKKSSDSLQLLHRSGDPVVMLTWLMANRIYTPSSLLQADRTIAPLSVSDLQKLMPAMYDFFPFDETFERDINEGLDDERVTRVFFIFNLTTPGETKRIEQVAAIYTTNWGEMFCHTFLRPGPAFEKQPSLFLRKHLKQPVIDMPEMIIFIPKGSQCKRINLT